MNFQQIGARIRDQRKQANLTQEQLAEQADLSSAYLSHVEHGKKKISLTALAQIAKALEIPIETLFAVPQWTSSPILPEIQALLEECSEEEQRIIFEVAKTLKHCLQQKNFRA